MDNSVSRYARNIAFYGVLALASLEFVKVGHGLVKYAQGVALEECSPKYSEKTEGIVGLAGLVAGALIARIQTPSKRYRTLEKLFKTA